MEVGRKYTVFQEEQLPKPNADCRLAQQSSEEFSTLTFLNFILATASIVSNINSNSNTNNDNNNNNNNNDLNLQISNSNNNVKNDNTVTFRPATGRRRRRKRRVRPRRSHLPSLCNQADDQVSSLSQFYSVNFLNHGKLCWKCC